MLMLPIRCYRCKVNSEMSFNEEMDELQRMLEADGFIKFMKIGPLYETVDDCIVNSAVERIPTRPMKVHRAEEAT